jgi:hypothetical protein
MPTVRNANYTDLLALLNEQKSRSIDLVMPAAKMHFVDGMLAITGMEHILEEDGFTDPNGMYWPTQVFDDQLAERLDITTAYLRRLRHGKTDRRDKISAVSRLDLWDANVNGLLGGRKMKMRGETVLRDAVPADPRSFFLRLLRPEDGIGIARAMLSNRFARLDNVDGLLAMLAGIRDAGVASDSLRIYGDLSESKMFVHVSAPEIMAAAPGLLAGYRSPFDTPAESAKRRGPVLSMDERIELGRQFRESGRGDPRGPGFYTEGNEPLVHAGFLLSNSEVGAGRWQIMPEITVLACSNGMTMTKDGFARSHVGSRMDEGRVEWSADTQGKELALVTAQTRDVVKSVLSQDYLEAKIAELEGKAGKPVEEPEKVIEVVAKKYAFSKEEQDGILRHFLLGGQLTSGGVMNAITSYSQTVDSPDAAHDLNVRAVEAMELVAVMR